MNLALNGSSAIQQFEGSDAIEISDELHNLQFLYRTGTHLYFTSQ